MAPPKIPLLPRVTPWLTSVDPSEHWFFKGPFTTVHPGKLGINDLPYVRKKTRPSRKEEEWDPSVIVLTYVSRRAALVPQPISYNGKTVTIQRALFEHFRPDDVSPKYRTVPCPQVTTARDIYDPSQLPDGFLDQRFHCCNPWHAQALHQYVPPTVLPIEEAQSLEELISNLRDTLGSSTSQPTGYTLDTLHLFYPPEETPRLTEALAAIAGDTSNVYRLWRPMLSHD